MTCDIKNKMEISKNIVLPGEIVSETTEGLMCGTGVTVNNDKIIATVRGFVKQISQFISVSPMTSIYSPSVGDVVIGRIAQVQKQKWKVQIGCSVLADLRLANIYLPDEQFRRRTTADERNMRQYFDVGDILCAEIQQVQTDGLIMLHTRQQHPKKLNNGMVVEVPSRLIKRVPVHISVMEIDSFKYNVIFGLNGSIWISPEDPSGAQLLPRINNNIILLATYEQLVFQEAIIDAYQNTVNIPVQEIITLETAKNLGFVFAADEQ